MRNILPALALLTACTATLSDRDGDGCADDVDAAPYHVSADADHDDLPDDCEPCLGENTSGDADGDGTCDDRDPDDDDDGCLDGDDAAPQLASPGDQDDDEVPDDCDLCAGDDRRGDLDGDGQCSDLDPDDDGDGCNDPTDPRRDAAWTDADTDGLGDDCDLCAGDERSGDLDGDRTCDDRDEDDDGDHCLDAQDALIDAQWSDSDGDGLGEDCDPCAGATGDLDADRLCDDLDPDDDNDACPDLTDPTLDLSWPDPDGDGIGADCDLCAGDDRTGDADGDGTCDDLDPDDDGDGCADPDDLRPLLPSDDPDSDGLAADCDPCVGDNTTGDTDGDGTCDDLDPDDDGDGCLDPVDPAPLAPSDDPDGDGLASDCDLCLGSNSTRDTDRDGVCNDLDPDDDDDGCLDVADARRLTASVDEDGDGVPADCDACVGDDTVGDADRDDLCDDLDPDDDDDGCLDALDASPQQASSDSDNDGVANDCDLCLGPDDDGDANGDGLCDIICDGDNTTGDHDRDGVCDNLDACEGDDADGDVDGDGLCDDLDPCDGDNATGDSDGDGVCDGPAPNPCINQSLSVSGTLEQQRAELAAHIATEMNCPAYERTCAMPDGREFVVLVWLSDGEETQDLYFDTATGELTAGYYTSDVDHERPHCNQRGLWANEELSDCTFYPGWSWSGCEDLETCATFGTRLPETYEEVFENQWSPSPLPPANSDPACVGWPRGELDVAASSVHLPGLAETATPVGDLDGDGTQDLAVNRYYVGLVWYSGANGWERGQVRNNEMGRLTVRQYYPLNPVGPGDVDGDGHDDLLVGVGGYQGVDSALLFFGPVAASVLPRDADVTLTPAAAGSPTGMQVGALGDLNGDGLQEVYLTDPVAGTLHVLPSGPALRSLPATLPAASTTATWSGFSRHAVRAVNVGDLDGDGEPDLLAIVLAQDGSAVLSLVAGPILAGGDLSDAVATWTADASLGLRAELHVGDHDGDGALDVALSGTGEVAVWIVPLQTSGSHEVQAAATAHLPRDSAWGEVEASLGGLDLDSDGHHDLLVSVPTYGEPRTCYTVNEGYAPLATSQGVVLVVPGPLTGTIDLSSIGSSWLGQWAMSELGSRLASAGDLDGDGLEEVVLSAFNSTYVVQSCGL